MKKFKDKTLICITLILVTAIIVYGLITITRIISPAIPPKPTTSNIPAISEPTLDDILEPAIVQTVSYSTSEPKLDLGQQMYIDTERQYGEAAKYIAKTVFGEARGCNLTQQAAVIWCILNRVDQRSSYTSNDIIAVVTAKNQFHGYKASHPVQDDIYRLTMDVLMRWRNEKAGVKCVGRVLPKEYLYFYGDGTRNHFRTHWRGGTTWDFRWGSPYDA